MVAVGFCGEMNTMVGVHDEASWEWGGGGGGKRGGARSEKKRILRRHRLTQK